MRLEVQKDPLAQQAHLLWSGSGKGAELSPTATASCTARRGPETFRLEGHSIL